MAWFVNQSLFIVSAAFLLGLLVGWLFWGTRTASPSPADHSTTQPVTNAAESRPTADPETRQLAGVPDSAPETRPLTAAPDSTPETRPLTAAPDSTPETRPLTAAPDSRPAVTGDNRVRPLAAGAATTTVSAVLVDDDLERIEGIGPKMAAALRAAGIHTFRQLSETDNDARRAAIEAAGLSFAPSLVTWGRQARLLADGDEEGFAELTRRLVAGRETGQI